MHIDYLQYIRKNSFLFLCFLYLLILPSCSSDDAVEFEGADLPDHIDFTSDINVILSDRCFKCHGPDRNAVKADLRLDTEEGMFAALGENKDRHAVVPGKPGESELYKRIISDDPDYMMPLPESNLDLSNREIALIKKWIEQGAEWKPHWAY
ncbi:MAG: c-type cytochrome domain-containing protein, partial [Balneolales bacterium]